MSQDYKNILKEKFSKKSIEILSIEKIDKDPRPKSYFELSFGSTIEREFFYKIKYKNADSHDYVFCLVVTFLNLFILRTAFYREKGDTTKQVYLNDFSNWHKF